MRYSPGFNFSINLRHDEDTGRLPRVKTKPKRTSKITVTQSSGQRPQIATGIVVSVLPNEKTLHTVKNKTTLTPQVLGKETENTQSVKIPTYKGLHKQKGSNSSINHKRTKQNKPDKTHAGDSWLVAVLLCLFLGCLGIHRFYLGYNTIGIIQLLTFGLFGIWTLIDLVRILIGTLKPKDGDYMDK